MKKVLIALIIIFSSNIINAQFRDIFSFNSGGMISAQWNMSAPIGEMRNAVSLSTIRGFSIDYRHCYKHNFIFGGRTGLNVFYEDKGISNIVDNSASVYVRDENTIRAIPLLFNVDYMVPSQKFIPYAGIGLGVYFMKTTSVTNISGTLNTNSVHFGVSPEAGISIPFIISNFGLSVSTRYNFVLKSAVTNNFSWFDFNIGLSFMY